MKRTRELLALLLTLVLAFSSLFAGITVVAAETGTNFDLSKSKEATQLNENYESDVTISLPAANYKGYLDVAFVLDGSTSHDNTNLAAAAATLLDELLDYKNLTVKVSITIFGGFVPILKTTELLELTENNVEDLQKFLTTDYDGLTGRSGSNLQAGVEKARSLLNADTEVDGSDKYMVILTDGGARMWYDSESGEAMSQTYLTGSNEVYWNSNEDWLHRYGDTDTTQLRSFSSIWEAGQSSTDIGKYGKTYTDYLVAVTSDTSIASWSTVENGVDYYTTYEAACYYAAASIVTASQEVNVCMVTYQYNPAKNYGYFTEDFKTWLESYVTRYDIAQTEGIAAETAAAVFSKVKDRLIQLVDAGSVLVDEMGDSVDENGVAYDFDFINDISRLTLTVDGVALDVTQISENIYGFGVLGDSSDGKTYPYVLTYYPNGTIYKDITYGECFILEINVPITKNDQVQLTYSVVLTNPQTASGTYGTYDQYGENNDGSSSYSLYTNNVARLYPVDSDGNEGDPEDFNKPTVSYTVTTDSDETQDDEEDQQSESSSSDSSSGSGSSDNASEVISISSAQTGDSSNIILWIVLLAGALAGVIL
ncbi:MAG: VWA domain-containing protein [Lachnospiraceae bacterium]|nr:VWA domain-containing protein [Lachnospiraceae bacterium]